MNTIRKKVKGKREPIFQSAVAEAMRGMGSMRAMRRFIHPMLPMAFHQRNRLFLFLTPLQTLLSSEKINDRIDQQLKEETGGETADHGDGEAAHGIGSRAAGPK